MEFFIVDAFTDELFKGNQAGVCILDEWKSDDLLQNIALENNLAETAFIVKKSNYYELRWFTPLVEVDLCGHATLASAYIVANFIDRDISQIKFHTKSGILTVNVHDDLYEMDFPTSKLKPVEITSTMKNAINVPIIEAYLTRDLLLIVNDEETVRNLKPNFEEISKLNNCLGVIVSAKGDTVDFVSRFFAPNVGVLEDSVTGSTHTTLTPFWANKLKKETLHAKQLSKRGGNLICLDCGNRVKISGTAKLYLKGQITI